MFKSVEYVGLDGKPELEAKARQLTLVLANEIRRWRGDVEVRWAPASDPDGALALTLALTLHEGVAATHSGTFTPDDLSEPWLTRSRCRDVWSDLLEDLSHLLDARIRQGLIETVEV
jgi:hypothetical protein